MTNFTEFLVNNTEIQYEEEEKVFMQAGKEIMQNEKVAPSTRGRRGAIHKNTDTTMRTNQIVQKEDYEEQDLEFDESNFEIENIRRETVKILKKQGVKKEIAETPMYKVLLEGVECLFFTPKKPFFIIQIFQEDEEMQQVKLELNQKIQFMLDSQVWMVQTTQTAEAFNARNTRYDNTATSL